jgi:hypothetical protein
MPRGEPAAVRLYFDADLLELAKVLFRSELTLPIQETPAGLCTAGLGLCADQVDRCERRGLDFSGHHRWLL